MTNKELIRSGLYDIYNNRSEESALYLDQDLIDNILDQLEERGVEDSFNFCEYIDDIIINHYGFNPDGSERSEEEAAND